MTVITIPIMLRHVLKNKIRKRISEVKVIKKAVRKKAKTPSAPTQYSEAGTVMKRWPISLDPKLLSSHLEPFRAI